MAFHTVFANLFFNSYILLFNVYLHVIYTLFVFLRK